MSLELMDSLIEQSKKYTIVLFNFRAKKEDDCFIITQVFDGEADIWVWFGNFYEYDDIFDCLMNGDDISDYVNEEGVYEAKALLEYDEGFFISFMDCNKIESIEENMGFIEKKELQIQFLETDELPF